MISIRWIKATLLVLLLFSARNGRAQNTTTPPEKTAAQNSPFTSSDLKTKEARHAVYLKLAAETEAVLQKDVLEVWFPRCVDQEHGGFAANFNRAWKPTRSEGKFSVFQGRMTWITAQIVMRRPELKEQYLPYTRHGLKYLNEVMWDKEAGGTHWGLDDNGKNVPAFGDDKQLYGIAFCLYAVAAEFQATQDAEALELAIKIFNWLDDHAHDSKYGGYYEWLKRDGTPILAAPNTTKPVLRFGLPVGGKSMNAHIHLLEALAQLYEVWPDEILRKRLEEVLLVVRDKICREPGVMHLYFTLDWQPTSERDSYGHDIETAYLLLDAAKVLKQENDPQTQKMARLLVDHSLEIGWDETYGGLLHEGPMLGKPDDFVKEWWVQMESLNALLLMHEQYSAESEQYFKKFEQQWHFIKTYQIDSEFHGVYDTLRRDGTPTTQAKGRIWKEAYHDGRTLLNVTERLNRLAEKAK